MAAALAGPRPSTRPALSGGTADDYQRLADELGCTGWGWPEMLDAFRTAEDDADYGGDGWNGKGGPIPLRRSPPASFAPLTRAIRTALEQLGHPCRVPGLGCRRLTCGFRLRARTR